MKTKSRSPDNVDECEADNMTEDSDKDLKKSSNNEINAEISKQNYRVSQKKLDWVFA